MAQGYIVTRFPQIAGFSDLTWLNHAVRLAAQVSEARATRFLSARGVCRPVCRSFCPLTPAYPGSSYAQRTIAHRLTSAARALVRSNVFVCNRSQGQRLFEPKARGYGRSRARAASKVRDPRCASTFSRARGAVRTIRAQKGTPGAPLNLALLLDRGKGLQTLDLLD